jgi:hypothetical protein
MADDFINLEVHPDTGKAQTRLTATISDLSLLHGGKALAIDIIRRMVYELITAHRKELSDMVRRELSSDETKEYVKQKTREMIDQYIQAEVQEIFQRSRL